MFIKGKPTDTGVKYYFISDPKTGYCFTLLIHNTNDVFPYQDIYGKNFGLTWSLISGLTTENGLNFLNKGHVFYFDRYYTSVELFYELANAKTYAVGMYMLQY